MTPVSEPEIAANLERAEQSIQAAKDLASKGYHDFSASRAYYATFYAATIVAIIGWQISKKIQSLNKRADFF